MLKNGGKRLKFLGTIFRGVRPWTSFCFVGLRAAAACALVRFGLKWQTMAVGLVLRDG